MNMTWGKIWKEKKCEIKFRNKIPIYAHRAERKSYVYSTGIKSVTHTADIEWDYGEKLPSSPFSYII